MTNAPVASAIGAFVIGHGVDERPALGPTPRLSKAEHSAWARLGTMASPHHARGSTMPTHKSPHPCARHEPARFPDAQHCRRRPWRAGPDPAGRRACRRRQLACGPARAPDPGSQPRTLSHQGIVPRTACTCAVADGQRHARRRRANRCRRPLLALRCARSAACHAIHAAHCRCRRQAAGRRVAAAHLSGARCRPARLRILAYTCAGGYDGPRWPARPRGST